MLILPYLRSAKAIKTEWNINKNNQLVGTLHSLLYDEFEYLEDIMPDQSSLGNHPIW
jgi:hypothetical protein